VSFGFRGSSQIGRCSWPYGPLCLGLDLAVREGKRMPNRSPEVDRFMEGLHHPLKDGIERLRAAILDSNDQITEHIIIWRRISASLFLFLPVHLSRATSSCTTRRRDGEKRRMDARAGVYSASALSLALIYPSA
jgi:hypothetical protein